MTAKILQARASAINILLSNINSFEDIGFEDRSICPTHNLPCNFLWRQDYRTMLMDYGFEFLPTACRVILKGSTMTAADLRDIDYGSMIHPDICNDSQSILNMGVAAHNTVNDGFRQLWKVINRPVGRGRYAPESTVLPDRVEEVTGQWL